MIVQVSAPNDTASVIYPSMTGVFVVLLVIICIVRRYKGRISSVRTADAHVISAPDMVTDVSIADQWNSPPHDNQTLDAEAVPIEVANRGYPLADIVVEDLMTDDSRYLFDAVVVRSS